MSFSAENKLPADCLLEIFSYLSLDDMMQVKNVCRDWYQVSQHWFKQVQSLACYADDPSCVYWEVWEKNNKRLICTGCNHKKLISILHLYGHHIKYYEIGYYAEPKNQINELSELIFQLVPRLCKNIVDINISRVRSYPPSAYKDMARHWRKLEKLSIEYFPLTVGEDFFELLRNNKQLMTLSLEFWLMMPEDPLNDEFFAHLPETIENIKIIIFNSCFNKGLKHFISASKNFTSLRVLNFKKLYLSDAVALAIANIKSLIYLRLDSIRCESCRTIELISNIKGLKSLDLPMNPDLREDSLINIVESCTQLERLHLHHWRKLTDKGMAAISKLEGLKILDIYAGFVSNQSIINLCSNLEVLFCSCLKMNHSDTIKLLEKATNLRFVEFDNCENLTKDIIMEARRIASERKKNILYIVGGDFCDLNDEEMNTPYFKYFSCDKSVPLGLFPKYIRNVMEESIQSRSLF